jgi:hypothetical protein
VGKPKNRGVSGRTRYGHLCDGTRTSTPPRLYKKGRGTKGEGQVTGGMAYSTKARRLVEEWDGKQSCILAGIP